MQKLTFGNHELVNSEMGDDTLLVRDELSRNKEVAKIRRNDMLMFAFQVVTFAATLYWIIHSAS